MFEELKKKEVFVDSKDVTDYRQKQGYVYILLNFNEHVKIGITKNPYQRVKSLSGSNTGGSEIIRYYFSDPMYIYETIEKVMHNKFKKYRIAGEWFYGKDLYYEDVIEELESLCNSNSFKTANEARRRFYEKDLKLINAV
jgi:hypothetical protein